MRKCWSLLSAFLFGAFVFNKFAQEIVDLNAKIRTFVVSGSAETRAFDQNGLPTYRNARIGEYRSPFYVVHYGLEYSEACRASVADVNQYHWIKDETLEYWHSSPLEPSIDLFRQSVEWVVQNTEYDRFGNAHLFYHFDWPYPNHPGGVLRAPWWSGLTEGHVITLLLRAADCFGNDQFAALAGNFYRSISTPVSHGGSLLTLQGFPWIEEYVDPRADEDRLSRVFNGMVYAYFGVTAYEEYTGTKRLSDDLRASIIENTKIFDSGFWSHYDAIGSIANLKYHRINLALIEDSRIDAVELREIASRWRVGSNYPVIFYTLHGPSGIARYQFIVSLLLSVVICFGLISLIMRKLTLWLQK